MAVGSTLASELLLVRYNADGTTDTTFGGGDGMVVTRLLGEATAARDLAVDALGRLVIAGSVLGGPGGSHFLVARYRPDGTLDPTFGGDGIVTTEISFSDGAEALALQANGKLVVAGYAESNFAVVRYNPKGSLTITNTTAGTADDDTLVGTSGSDFIYGLGGNDTITGGDGNDCI